MAPDAITRRALWAMTALLVGGALLVGAPAKARQAQQFPIFRPKIAPGPSYRPGQVMVRLADGASIQPVAQALHLQVDHQVSFNHSFYVLRGMPQASVPGLVAAAAKQSGVVNASPVGIYRLDALAGLRPNDPNLNLQWALQRSGAAVAQKITVGQRARDANKTVVAIVDSGVSPTHPDLQNQIPNLPGANTSPLPDDPPDNNTADNEGHGTHVAGDAAALTNNGIGIASQNWEGVTILPVKAGRADGTLTDEAISAGIIFAADHGADVINLSFGGTAPSDLMHLAVIYAVQKGAVVVCSAGNDGVNEPHFPSDFDECISVAALGPAGERAVYSNFGPGVDLAASGGNDPNFDTASKEILSTSFDPVTNTDGYAFEQGTSMAAPQVAGAVAALIAHHAVDGLPKDDTRVDAIKDILYSTATNPNGQRTDFFGFGELNLAAAIKATSYWIEPITPAFGSTTPSFSEPLRAIIHSPVFGSAPIATGNDVQLIRDVPDNLDCSQGILIDPSEYKFDDASGELDFLPGYDANSGELDLATAWKTGINRPCIVVTDPNDPSQPVATLIHVEDANPDGNGADGQPLNNAIPAADANFNVVPRQELKGLKMFSIPAALLPVSNAGSPSEDPQAWEFLFSTSSSGPITAFRWLTSAGFYARYETAGSIQDAEATPVGNSVQVDQPPIGIGFWIRQDTGPDIRTLQLFGVSDTADQYEIPLAAGWTMIGDPFLTPVSWTNFIIEYQGRNYNVRDAVAAGLVDPALFGWDGTRYVAEIPPAGQIRPFEARWIHASVPVTLLVSRNALAGALEAKPWPSAAAASPKGGWQLPFSASVGGTVYGQVTIGTAQNAVNGRGVEDLIAPPPAITPVDLRVRHDDWGKKNGLYAQDLRSATGGAQVWNLDVQVRDPGTEVTLSWPAPPKGVRLVIQDAQGGQNQLSRSAGRMVLPRLSPGTRRVRVTALPPR